MHAAMISKTKHSSFLKVLFEVISFAQSDIDVCAPKQKKTISQKKEKHCKIAKDCPKYIPSVVKVSSCSYQKTF